MNDDEADVDAVLRRVSQGPAPDDHADDGRLAAYGRGEVTGEERESIERHLVACSECRQLLADYDPNVTAAEVELAQDKLPQPRSRRRRRTAVAATLVAAAVTVVALLPKRELPAFSAEGPLGGVARVRGEEPTNTLFVPSSHLRWLLRPETPTSDVALLVFVETSDAPGVLRAGPTPTIETGPSGVIRYEVRAEALLGRAFGPRTIHLVLTTADEAPRPTPSGSRDEVERALGPHRWMTWTIDYRSKSPWEE
ncbi:MAG: zf-HC2 domain-containing protein [Deltaproteobacteria bacterium]|jgi:hypothetical protein